MPADTYKPIVRRTRGHYSGAAMVGVNSVIVGWTVDPEHRPSDLKGFAFRKIVFDENGDLVRSDFLRGHKRFESMGADATRDFRTVEAPLQRFRWSDYAAEPGHSYRYEVIPMTGRPGSLERGDPLRFDIRTSEHHQDGLGVYANRGVTSAAAYLRRFHGLKPHDVPEGRAFQWLERGLLKSLLDFIAAAKDGESLHVCIYEFFLEDIGRALKLAQQRGVNVRIVYHAKANDKATHENEEVLRHVGLKSKATARTNVGGISHNKFIVHLTRAGNPKRVWTGSANFSENAFYYQTNVALVFDDRDLAAAYERYFQLLDGNPKRGRKKAGSMFARDHVAALNDDVNQNPPGAVSQVLFSPVRSQHVVETAIGLIGEAKSAVFLSAPFGVGANLIEAIEQNPSEALEYGLANTTAKRKIADLRKGNTKFFWPSRLKKLRGEAWDAKAFGAHKIHAKTLIIDPWSSNPTVLIGSANFSKPSCVRNDENTLLIRGDRRLAAILSTEFLRMYDHYKIRYWIRRTQESGDTTPLLLDETSKWADIYYKQSRFSRKLRDRQVFAGLP